MENIQIAIEFSHKNGYDTAIICDVPEWKYNGQTVYIAMNSDSENRRTGYPAFIIIENNKARFANINEIDKIMGFTTVPEGFYNTDEDFMSL